MLALPNIADMRMQQQIAHELYRQQIMQRLPDPLCGLLPNFGTHFVAPTMAQPSLPGVEAKLENNELWQQFHHIGTEMIITKSGRRMFPSMRVSLSGLEEEANYCVLLEMVPIGDCRYKFSGSQWVPAGGAEPQSPQRMFLHPDSPATGKHWQSQALLFSKVKLTNNTLDNNGHIVLASMHKYQPRLHVIRTSDLTQIPWAPQQAYVFPETEFIAVTAYQNDRITKLKIDNNPFAKGFRETGQSRCKRKLNDSSAPAHADVAGAVNDMELTVSPSAKRLRLTEELSLLPQQQATASGLLVPRHYLLDTLEANFYLSAPPPPLPCIDYARHIASYPSWAYSPSPDSSCASSSSSSGCDSAAEPETETDTFVDVVGTTTSAPEPDLESESISRIAGMANAAVAAAAAAAAAAAVPKPKRSSFSILDILGVSVSS
ncbi:T-box transcription factor TBX6 [Drosophila hydei]|uniref:T-box transcription factor TBX6 n=1 Tax=Drosophila hydei TaxID=7224 RepID=A0A6J2SRP1_DROHY|nr:T-box transcription factor TBX6 [Drosophila hydei]XP_030078820.1 T-box transcription factor TBX6 [Drosophila hydei]